MKKRKKNYDVARESEQIMQERNVSGKSMFFSCNLHDDKECYTNKEKINVKRVVYIYLVLVTYNGVEN